MKRFLTRAAADEKGAAAIEFALVLPVLLMLNIGAMEALQVYQAQRNVAHVAAVLADMTAQNRTVTEAELQDTLGAGLTIMYPFPTTDLQQRLSSLTANASGAVGQDWLSKRNYVIGGAPSVPSGYLGANESVIVSDVVYDYRPTFRMFLPRSMTITRHAYARPRLTLKVEKVTN